MLIIFYWLLILRVGRCRGDQRYEAKTAIVGRNIKLTCTVSSFTGLYWIRAVPENVPEILGKAFNSHSVDPRIRITGESETFVLRISKVEINDAGVYYCISIRPNLTFLKRIDLRVEAPLSDSDCPEDSLTVQCLVRSDSKKTIFPGQQSLCCFTSGSHQSYPVFNHSNIAEEFEKNPEELSTRKCVPSHFWNITSISIYNNTVAKCAQACGGNGSKPNTEVSAVNIVNLPRDNILVWLLSAALAISAIIIACLIYSTKKHEKTSFGCCKATVLLQRTTMSVNDCHQSQQADEDSVVYSAPTFTRRKSCKAERMDAETEVEVAIYTAVRALEMNSTVDL